MADTVGFEVKQRYEPTEGKADATFSLATGEDAFLEERDDGVVVGWSVEESDVVRAIDWVAKRASRNQDVILVHDDQMRHPRRRGARLAKALKRLDHVQLLRVDDGEKTIVFQEGVHPVDSPQLRPELSVYVEVLPTAVELMREFGVEHIASQVPQLVEAMQSN